MKKKLIVSSLVSFIGLLSLSACNSWKDPNDEYIMNPNLSIYKKYEWTTWKDSVGGRLSHDPKWFILPASHYIPKEVAFDWGKVKDLAIDYRRSQYFAHLCKTEYLSYQTPDYPIEILNHHTTSTSTVFYPRFQNFPIKNMKQIVNNNPKKAAEIFEHANKNPFINPEYGYHNWKENMQLRFDLKSNDFVEADYFYPKPKSDTFREYMLDDGSIWRIRFDSKTQSFLPLVKVDKPEAKYYLLYREIERPQMHKLAIIGYETIIVNREENKLIYYSKSFTMARYNTYNDFPTEWFGGPGDWFEGEGCRFYLTPPYPVHTVDDLSK